MIALLVVQLVRLLPKCTEAAPMTGQNDGDDEGTRCVDRPWTTTDREVRTADAPLGAAIAFSCHYCGERDKGEARLWYKSDRYSAVRRWKEVALGMLDEFESNRVRMTVDHSLVVRNLSADDAGRYSCSGLGSDERVEFALDMVPSDRGPAASADSVADWTRFEKKFFAPVVARYAAEIREMTVDWDAWGPCDGCAGKRYRRAACRVRLIDGNRTACRSIGLSTIVGPATVAALSSVPDFLLAETCYAYCQMHSSNRLHRYPKYRNTFVLAEGSSLTLKCAEATVDTKVIWRRDGLLLTDTNTDDVSGVLLDAFGTLYLVGVTVAESGNYTCYIDGNRTQEVLVAIRKSSLFASQGFTRHLGYLFYVFALYFIIFGARLYHAFLNRHTFLKITEDDVLESEIPTAYLGKQIRIH